MEKNEIIKIIEEQLLDGIRNYHQTKKLTHLDQEYIQVLSTIWKQINNSNLTVSCPSCISFALDVIGSYYSREINKIPAPEIKSSKSKSKKS